MFNPSNLHTSFIVGDDGFVKISPIARAILGDYNSIEERITNIDSFNKRINDVLSCIGFSSKKIDYDEFIKKSYHDFSVRDYSIKGVGTYYIYPKGSVCFHESNKFFYDVANIVFMINEKLIPMNLINSESIDFTKTIIIPRKSGAYQDGMVGPNTSLKISKSKEGVWVFVNFSVNDEPYEKHVKLGELMDINSINSFSFNIPKINKEDYEFENYEHLTNELIDEIIEYYNNEVVTYMEKFISENMTEITTEYDVTNENGKFNFTKK